MPTTCERCYGALWVCEEHATRPWGGESEHPDACRCGGAGMPCPQCNQTDGSRNDRPRLPEGYVSFISADEE